MRISGSERRQQNGFLTGMPLFAMAMFFLAAALYCCFNRTLLLAAVFLLAVGLLLLVLGMRRVKREAEAILRFIRERSVFYHRCSPALTISDFLSFLRQEGFVLTEYPFGNYYGHWRMDQKHICHFFVANNDTPDCPEAESYSELFIRTVCESGMSAGSQYLLDLEYGSGLEQKSPQYIQAAREGFMHDKQGIPFGFRLAFDTRDHILYCAEAVTRIVWQKNEVPAICVSELLKKLLKSPDVCSGKDFDEMR